MKIKSLFVDKLKGLRDFNIDFNEGVTVLIGENGTGKTTILETIYKIVTSPNSCKKKLSLVIRNWKL